MEKTIDAIIERQNAFFATHKTLDVNFRLTRLKKLKNAIVESEKELLKALKTDLGKSEFEAFSNEIGLAKKEISFHIRKLKSWTKPKRVPTPVFAFPSRSYIQKQPYGRVLIIGPFNFPFMLTIIPLIGAISAGNVVVVKPSENTTETSEIIEKIVAASFDPGHVAYVQGGIELSTELLEKRWDKIFFTGSTRVGKIVMQAAAKHLTPVELELGGKNPVIVDQDANLKIAAKRIVWGKHLNTGQSCVSPDYLLVHEDVKEKLLALMEKTIVDFYSEDPQKSSDFGRIINENAVERIAGLIKQGKVYTGGKIDTKNKYISPTILTDVSPDSEVMQDEIFGPVLPVLTFRNLQEAFDIIRKKEKPLVLYYFSENRKKQKAFLNTTFSGDASINDVVIHFTNFSLPFGGVGYSGMGTYHGKHSFETFSHRRSVMRTSTGIDLPMRYPPAKGWVYKLVRILFR